MPDESATRDAIVAAAERLFARRGYAAITIKDIGNEAGVNAALLYYYFADKETLYREVLRRLIGRMAEEGLRRLDPGIDPETAVRRLVELQVELMTAQPHLPQLMARELVDHRAAHAEEPFTQLAASVFRRLCDFIEKGQRDGVFRTDLDPRFAAISVVSQVVYVFIARPAVGILLGTGRDGVSPATLRAFGQHAADFASAALRRPETAGGDGRGAGRRAKVRGKADNRGRNGPPLRKRTA